MNAVMLDLETMDVAPSAAILTIGAVHFDPFGQDTEETLRTPERTFYARISLDSNTAQGRTMSAGTVKWWLGQTDSARNELLQAELALRTAILTFRMWASNLTPRADRVWAKSPEFDVVILKHAFDQLNEVWPFKFWNSRDVRTATELAYPEGNEPKIGVGTAHNALDDAIRQALMVQHCHQILHPN
jgi:hypothetical protein